LIGALAGMGLAGNLLVWLIAWSLFLSAIYHWVNARGIGCGFLIIRDDYED
jgi:hypothetical protein